MPGVIPQSGRYAQRRAASFFASRCGQQFREIQVQFHTARGDFCVEAPGRMYMFVVCVVSFGQVGDTLSDVPCLCLRRNAGQKFRQIKIKLHTAREHFCVEVPDRM